MPFERKVTRFGHSEGHTNACYTEDGESVISSGVDGDIRIWHGIDDDDPITGVAGEFIVCLVHFDNRMLVGSDLNTVQALTFPDIDRDGTEFRFTAPATSIRVDSRYIAAGSEDTTIKVIKRDKSEEAFDLMGHEGPILKIDLSINELLAASSGDGTIRIWDLKTKKVVKKIDGLEQTNTFFAAKNFVTPTFDPKYGKFLAYPKDLEIIVVDTANWEVKFTLVNENVRASYTTCTFSPCGRYIVAGTLKGEIAIWEVSKKQCLDGDIKGDTFEMITSLLWNPKNNGELLYADKAGQFGILVGCNEKAKITSGGLFNDAAEEVDFEDINFQDDPDDEDNENCVSLERLKNDTMRAAGILDDDENDDDDMKSSRATSRQSTNIISTVKFVPLQPPFQPGATPEHLEHRFLIWNEIGIVRHHKTDSENAIEVEFHDASIHHGIHMSNYLNHTMSSLSSSVVALTGGTSSKLTCITLGASGSREWSVTLPNCEEALAVTATEKVVAIATDTRYLRIFSAMGTQREIISIPGPVIALAGHGDKIMVAFHSATCRGEPSIAALLINAIGLTLRSREIHLPITKTSKLTWIGYSDKGSPLSYDSAGILRIYNMTSNLWYPIFDTALHAKGASDSFYIIDVSEFNQIVRGILCRGASFPVTSPRPMVNEYPMQQPLCEDDTEKSQLEEILVRYSNFQVENCEKIIKETAIKLFAMACRAETESRAKELIEMIASPQLVPLAAKYASKLGRIHLAERLGQLLPQIEEIERQRENTEQNLSFNDSDIMSMSLINSARINSFIRESLKTDNPIIAPKTISKVSKRNPFKRSLPNSPMSSSLSSPKLTNPLSHLTDKAIGFTSTDALTPSPVPSTPNEKNDDKTIENNKNTENIETGEKQSRSSPNKFMTWFTANKEDLEKEFPDVIPVELTKQAMRKFKQIMSDINKDKNTEKNVSSAKRKLDVSEMSSSGISKLAKFGFNK